VFEEEVFGPIAEMIFERTGLTVEAVLVHDELDIINALSSEPPRAQIASLSSFAYLAASERNAADPALIWEDNGQTSNTSQIFVRSDSGILNVEDLKGRIFCRPDPTIISGWFMPWIMLNSFGVSPSSDLAELIDSGSQEDVIWDVYNNTCDTGCSYVDVKGLTDMDAEVMNEIQVINALDFPFPGIFFQPSISDDIRQLFVDVLINIDETEEGQDFLFYMYGSNSPKLVSTDDAFFEPLRQALAAAGWDAVNLILDFEHQSTEGEPIDESVVGGQIAYSADGAEMVYVPEGEFLMGASEDDVLADSDEKPQRSVFLDAYWIYKHEVSNGQYRSCIEEGICSGSLSRYPADRYPAAYISSYQAEVYCNWIGGRLPTEAEWEKAARGNSTTLYSWGDDSPSCNRANYEGCVGASSTLGSYPDGANSYGIQDLAGNVWEWVSDWYGSSYYRQSGNINNPFGPESGEYRVIRGGGWGSPEEKLRISERGWVTPNWNQSTVGFRCVISP
jgi:formylglycine-generating enzyme required for sulfatase activity/ABC-type phosphate/phosphonate transport system substrate-binding protein